MSSARATRRHVRSIGIGLAAAIALAPATLAPGSAYAASSDLPSVFGGLGSTGEQPTLPEVPPPSAAAIRLDGAKNFRDIGGYRTADGRTVRTGLVFRSNKLSTLTDADQAKLTAARVTLDVDLRNASERKEAPDRMPPGVRYQVADVVGLDAGIAFHEAVPVTLGRALIDAAINGSSDIGQSIGYPFMVNYRGSDVAFRDLLTAIAGNPDGATVYHCSAGKDRTGWGTAILLTVLGVPRNVVSADFMASNAYLGREDAVELSWLNAAFAQVDRLYGGMDAYVRDGLGVDQATIDTLRSTLLA
ncbi:tyrosine/lipid phosphatase LipA [Rhodococcus olei]|uniref:Tyrosine/lipid phosphatase LipA n=1 Tax=Rhodococcus olei TaxID=2161675 RepID=A0ABP8PMV3_9NOCA